MAAEKIMPLPNTNAKCAKAQHHTTIRATLQKAHLLQIIVVVNVVVAAAVVVLIIQIPLFVAVADAAASNKAAVRCTKAVHF